MVRILILRRREIQWGQEPGLGPQAAYVQQIVDGMSACEPRDTSLIMMSEDALKRVNPTLYQQMKMAAFRERGGMGT